jgi:hypothetical protein
VSGMGEVMRVGNLERPLEQLNRRFLLKGRWRRRISCRSRRCEARRADAAGLRCIRCIRACGSGRRAPVRRRPSLRWRRVRMRHRLHARRRPLRQRRCCSIAAEAGAAGCCCADAGAVTVMPQSAMKVARTEREADRDIRIQLDQTGFTRVRFGTWPSPTQAVDGRERVRFFLSSVSACYGRIVRHGCRVRRRRYSARPIHIESMRENDGKP